MRVSSAHPVTPSREGVEEETCLHANMLACLIHNHLLGRRHTNDSQRAGKTVSLRLRLRAQWQLLDFTFP